MAAGRIPPEFLPLQSGVGNVCNAVLGSLATCEGFPRFKVFTEVLQDAMLDLIAVGYGDWREHMFADVSPMRS